jgi:hypothetical protein
MSSKTTTNPDPQDDDDAEGKLNPLAAEASHTPPTAYLARREDYIKGLADGSKLSYNAADQYLRFEDLTKRVRDLESVVGIQTQIIETFRGFLSEVWKDYQGRRLESTRFVVIPPPPGPPPGPPQLQEEEEDGPEEAAREYDEIQARALERVRRRARFQHFTARGGR